MKLLLIRPNIGRLEHSLFVDEARMEPLQLGVLAGLTPPDVEVELSDDRCEEIPFDRKYNLVAITVETYTARRAYEISEEFRKRDVPVILGGMHITLVPDEAASHADSILTGDAETVWTEVIDDARRGVLKPRYNGPPGIPQPGTMTRRDLFKNKGYLPITLLQFGRGCRYSCSYCAVSSYFHRQHYKRNIDEVIREIELQDRKTLFFVDDNITADHHAAKELFRALIPLKIKWVSQASMDITTDRELLTLMRKSGCLGNVIGFESLSAENLSGTGKAANISAASGDYRTQIRILRDFGFQTWAAFTLGYDGDSPESIERMLDFSLENRFTFAAFNILMPYPGTEFYRKLKRENRLLYDGKWWLHPEYRFNHASYIPAQMTPGQLTGAGLRCRSVFNSPGSIFRRAFDLKTNMRNPLQLGIYCLYNPLFRQETFKKQGMHLGYSE